MSIQSEITRISSNIANTYSALEEQGATMPTALTSDNLAATVGTLNSGTKVYYVEGTGTTAGAWTGTIEGLTAYYDGLAILYKVNIAGASATTLNINGLGAITCRRNASALTTHIPVNSVVLLTYTTISGTGYFVWADYSSSSVTQTVRTTNGEFPLLLRGTSAGTASTTNTTTFGTKMTANPSTGAITATSFIGALTGNADTATKAAQDGNGNVIDDTYATKAELGSVPDYVRTEAERLAARVQPKQGPNTMTMMFGSDVHLSLVHTNAAQMLESVTHAGQAMKFLKDTVNMDFSAILGDLVWDDGETYADGMQAMRTVHQLLGEHDFWTEGNHDCHYKSGAINRSEKFAQIGGWNKGAVYDSANRLGGYCYRDYSDYKVRVICLNTCEDTTGDMTVSTAQINWLKTAISGMVDGWKCILLSHHPLNWLGNSTTIMTTIAGYKDKILCNIHGHAHCFLVAELGSTGIKRITIPNINFYRNNEYGTNGAAEYGSVENGETTTYNKTASSGSDTAFCVLTLDLDNEVIYADCYGAGYDRIISLAEELQAFTITNTLTCTTNSNSATSITEGAAYSATLTANSGYELSSVKVTMGGSDVTSSVYINGTITISSVTGDIVITAVSTETSVTPSYTNLVPTALDYDLSGIYSSTGYRNGYYSSTTAPYTTATSDGSVVTGLFPLDWQGSDGTGKVTPPTIYIKGVTFDTSNSHNRFGFFRSDTKVVYTTQTVSALAAYYTIETLGTQYYKLTPIMQDGRNMFFVKFSENAFNGYVDYFAISANGDGANMIVTFDEPIE